ncbi:MAG: dual specificity protein phosphatase family protein [Acidobacteria bacterium]|nr:dual specificity protein phosphatase family protein [Acidobacteriota bacterium]
MSEAPGSSRRAPGVARSENAARRHAAIYGEGRVPAFERWKVEERLLAGRNPLSEVDVLELRSVGVSHLLDLREETEWLGPGRFGREAIEAEERLRLRRRWLPIPDGAAPEPATLRRAADWLDTALAAREAIVFVHCRAGLERTAAVLAAWIGRRDRRDLAGALASLRRFGYPGQPLAAQAEAVARFLRGDG